MFQRLIGQYTERTSPMGGFDKTFGFFPDKLEERSMGKTPRDNHPVLAMCRELARDLDAAEHYAMWLRFTGQNLHVMGCLQYFESNTGFTPPSCAHPCSRSRCWVCNSHSVAGCPRGGVMHCGCRWFWCSWCRCCRRAVSAWKIASSKSLSSSQPGHCPSWSRKHLSKPRLLRHRLRDFRERAE